MRKACIAATLFAALLAALACYRWRIWSFGSDTGTFTQAILAAGHGFVDGPEQGSHFFFHFSPILALLYPLLALTHAPLALQIVQVLLVAATGPAAYLLFAPYLGERAAAGFALLVLLYPPLVALAFGEFHELAFFPLLLVLMLWAADGERWGLFALFATACLATREDVCIELAVVCAGIALLCAMHAGSERRGLLFLEPRDRGRAMAAFALVAVAGALVPAVYYHWLFLTNGGWPHQHFYHYPFADGPLAVLLAIVTKPAVAIPALAQPGRLTYLLEAFAPLALLPLGSRWSWAALPGFAIVLLAAEQSVWRMGDHYAALWLPWVLVATGAALVRLRSRGGERLVARWVNVGIAASVLTLVFFDPSHPFHYLTPPYADVAAARAALGCVPADATVSTHDEWFSEIAGRYPNATIQRTSGVGYLVYADDFPNDRFVNEQLPRLREAVARGDYRIACAFGHVKTYVAESR